MFIHPWFLSHRGLGVHLVGDFVTCAVGITHLFDRCSQGTIGANCTQLDPSCSSDLGMRLDL